MPVSSRRLESLKLVLAQLWDDIAILISYSSIYELSEQDAELLLRLSRVWTRVTVSLFG